MSKASIYSDEVEMMKLRDSLDDLLERVEKLETLIENVIDDQVMSEYREQESRDPLLPKLTPYNDLYYDLASALSSAGHGRNVSHFELTEIVDSLYSKGYRIDRTLRASEND